MSQVESYSAYHRVGVMFEYTEKPARDLQKTGGAKKWLDACLVLAMPFEFAVHVPLDECLTRLENAKDGGFFGKIMNVRTRVSVVRRDDVTCEFSVLRMEGRGDGKVTARGRLIGTSAEATRIRGTVEMASAGSWYLALGFLFVAWALAITLRGAFLLLGLGVLLSIGYVQFTERRCIGFIRAVLTDDGSRKKKRTH